MPANYLDVMPKIIGHRGACGHAPENTLASFQKAAELKITSVEIDVMLTSDDACVICHDHDVRRCTNGSGKVRLKSLSELQQLDAGSKFGSEFSDQKIPTMAETFAGINKFEMSVNLEIKPLEGWQVPTALAVGTELANNAQNLPSLLISSFDIEALQTIKPIVPSIPLGYLSDTIPHNWQQRLADVGAASLHVDKDFVTPDAVKAVQAAGYKFLVYTVNDPEYAKQLLAWGVDGIITDFPDRLCPLV